MAILSNYLFFFSSPFLFCLSPPITYEDWRVFCQPGNLMHKLQGAWGKLVNSMRGFKKYKKEGLFLPKLPL